jgi:hypothetical protein
MVVHPIVLSLLLLSQTSESAKSAEDNALYRELRTKGATLGGQGVVLPAPTLRARADAAEEHKVLETVSGGPREIDAFMTDDKTATVVMKSHDLVSDKGVVCVRDVWFVIRSKLEKIDPERGMSGNTGTHPSTEGDMKITSEPIPVKVLALRGITPQKSDTVQELYVSEVGELFKEVFVEATNHVLATRDDDSWVIAFRTDPTFNDDPKLGNRWRPMNDRGKIRVLGKEAPYEGGCGYTKLTKLNSYPGALLVETHFAFWQPREWFGKSTKLLSKLPAAAKGHVLRVREELRKTKETAKPATGKTARSGG